MMASLSSFLCTPISTLGTNINVSYLKMKAVIEESGQEDNAIEKEKQLK